MTDRELDALVAEKVFGLTPCPHWEILSMGSAGWGWTPTNGCPHAKAEGQPTCYWDHEECRALYSSRVDAAFLVVEEMRKKGWDYEFAGMGIPKPAEGALAEELAHSAAFWPWGTDRELTSSCEIGPRAPRVWCLAALRALNVEIPA